MTLKETGKDCNDVLSTAGVLASVLPPGDDSGLGPMAGVDTGGDVAKPVASAACDGAVEGPPKKMGREARGAAGMLDPLASALGDWDVTFAPDEQLA